MPKKFAAENSKAVVARERKKQAKEEADIKRERQLQDAYWKDDDKNLQKKQQRKEAEEKKKQEALLRKAEAKALLEKEMGEAAKKTGKAPPPPKVTRAQIEAKKQPKVENEEKDTKIETHLDVPLEENINRIQIEGEEARTVDEAIAVLSTKDQDTDKHPERRRRAAFLAFEERRLKELKDESPTLRLSQLKQMVFKEWQKSPENPLNQSS